LTLRSLCSELRSRTLLLLTEYVWPSRVRYPLASVFAVMFFLIPALFGCCPGLCSHEACCTLIRRFCGSVVHPLRPVKTPALTFPLGAPCFLFLKPVLDSCCPFFHSVLNSFNTPDLVLSLRVARASPYGALVSLLSFPLAFLWLVPLERISRSVPILFASVRTPVFARRVL